MTSGFGGHSAAILEELNGGSLIATDQDPEAIRFLKSKLKLRKESVFTKLVLANYINYLVQMILMEYWLILEFLHINWILQKEALVS
ncbi:MAG: hypothetical protein Ct9H90mP13_04800 [Pseudomonadota bacterium]|nr:MAG: hypothetical protein Ct9H90mP13_04800 [Pseudomonadota bacterium]